jgi:muramidase (phage lysozyme)
MIWQDAVWAITRRAEFIKRSRKIRRLWTRSKFGRLLSIDRKLVPAAGLLMIIAVLAGIGIAYRQVVAPSIDPSAYTPLLNTIAQGESKGNYNAHFGNSTNTTIRFTDMTVSEVLQWQDAYVAQGHASSAVGKYQIINSTLRGLVQQMGIDQNAVFNEQLQDSMAIRLLERRGANDYVQNKLTREEFAANLAKEWAALPKIVGDNPEQSYYASDGINKVQISIEEIFQALATLQT